MVWAGSGRTLLELRLLDEDRGKGKLPSAGDEQEAKK